MKTSLIRYRVADFLRRYPPFQFFCEEELLELAASGRVQFHENSEFVFRTNQPRRPFIWVVQQGTVELLRSLPDREQLRDLLGEGAVLGLEAADRYTHSARTVSDVLLYALDAERFVAIVSRYPQAGRFVLAAEAVEGPLEARRTPQSRHAAADSLWLVRSGPARESIRRRMLLCSPSAPVGEAARMMARHGAEVVAVIDPEGRPLGAVTVAALRDRVATGEVSLEAPCRAIMHSGFPMLAPGFDTGAALLAMTRGRTCFAGITENGACDSPLQGIVTDRDLELYRGINPPLLLREILDAREATDLARARKQIEVMLADGMTEAAAVDWFCECLGELYAAILERAIDLSRPESDDWPGCSTAKPDPSLAPCWILFGVAGRSELLAPILPEIAVVYRDPPPEGAAPAQSYFKQWARRVLELLLACGLLTSRERRPPQAIPACLSLSAWKRFFERLVTDPIGQDIYDSRTLFDLRAVAGDHALAAELTDYLVELVRDHPVFIAVLANDSMINLPPLTLFRDLVVESDRAEHETLDLTRTLLDPLADVGRVFALARHPLAEAATTRRLECEAQSVRSRGALFSAAADAFRIGLYHRTGNAIRDQSEGSLVRPASLSRYDQQVLKGCFRTVLDLLELTWANFDSIRDL